MKRRIPTRSHDLDHAKGEVVFDHVRFSYPDNPDKVAHQVILPSMSGAGTKGCHRRPDRRRKNHDGKSPDAFLMKSTSGDIRIDGVSTSELTRENVHSLFGMVLQDTWLFEGTVRENLTYNKTGITDEELEKACRACGIFHFIETLPNGFDTVLGENITISAGAKAALYHCARDGAEQPYADSG